MHCINDENIEIGIISEPYSTRQDAGWLALTEEPPGAAIICASREFGCRFIDGGSGFVIAAYRGYYLCSVYLRPSLTNEEYANKLTLLL